MRKPVEVVVRNLPVDANTRDMENLFRFYGYVSCRIRMHDTGVSAIVKVQNRGYAELAIKLLNRKVFPGGVITIRRARPKK
jgi:hypothetical protein